MSSNIYDVVVIGSGPGGYVAAIRAAQLGLKTACIEKDKTLGGTCLNVGCIPSKALLDSSEHFHYAHSKLAVHGVQTSGVQLDLAQMMKRKDGVVSQLVNGVDALFKKNKVTRINGFGRMVDAKSNPKKISVAGESGETEVLAKNVILATGSVPIELPFMKFDEKRILSSTGALVIPEVPKHLVVVGGGVIGLELGSVWRRLGAEVTVIELQENIASGVDVGTAKQLQKSLENQGLKFRLGTKTLSSEVHAAGVKIGVEIVASGQKETIDADYALVSVGRRAFSDGLGLEECGIPKDNRGRVTVNENFQTSAPGVYAIGDLIDGPMLAHKAEDEGVAVAEIIGGQHGHVNYEAIPNVIYTWPELASVGFSEEELNAEGIPYKKGSFPFKHNGRAKAMDETEGMVKILSDKRTDRVLGVHILGPRASDMIAEAVTFMEFGASAEDIARTSHAHPTLAEIVKEAALAVDKRQIHM